MEPALAEIIRPSAELENDAPEAFREAEKERCKSNE